MKRGDESEELTEMTAPPLRVMFVPPSESDEFGREAVLSVALESVSGPAPSALEFPRMSVLPLVTMAPP